MHICVRGIDFTIRIGLRNCSDIFSIYHVISIYKYNYFLVAYLFGYLLNNS